MDGDRGPPGPAARKLPGIGYSVRLSDDVAPPPEPAAKRAEPTPPPPEPDSKPPKPDAPKNADAAEPEQKQPEKPPMPRWRKALYALGGLVVLAALVAGGTLYWLHARQFESTDDAFIDGYISQVSAQISARVVRLAVNDNDRVQAGQVLVELDPADYQVRLNQARAQRSQAAAQVAQAQAQLLLQQANLDQAAAQVRVAEADLGQAETDLQRYRSIDPKAITRQQLDTSSSTAKSARARLDASRQAVEGSRAQVEAQKATITAAEANLAAADVGVANAGLQLSYVHVTAPRDGRVTRRTVNLGNYVNPGQALLAVVGDEMWVTANYKETQLGRMQAGQPVRVRVDACPGLDLNAKVDSFQRGSGSIFSSLPAENATGNYVKVVQRIPVKIVFDDDRTKNCPLAPGLSVTPRTTIR